MDVVLRNAHAVTVGGRSDTDIAIINGKIAQMGRSSTLVRGLR